MAYEQPNYTQTPNAFFDEHLPEMGFAELKVVCFAMRKTFGWHKEDDRISLSQFVKGTGLSKRGVIDGIEAAMQRGVMHRKKDGQSYRYSLAVSSRSGEAASQEGTEVVKQLHRGSEVTSQVSGEAASHTKEKNKETKQKKKRSLESVPPKKTNGKSVPNEEGTPIDEAQAIWEDVCDAKPDAATAMTLHGSLATCDVDWQPSAFRKALKTAYRNVNLDAGRIRIGYLMDSYEREAARTEEKANPERYNVADQSALDRLEDRWGN